MTIPTPGHPDAVAAGCRCPIIDNGRGRCPTPWGWTINGDCPMHGLNPACNPPDQIQVSGPNLEECQ